MPSSRRHWDFSPAAEQCELLLFVFPNSCFISGPLSSSALQPSQDAHATWPVAFLFHKGLAAFHLLLPSSSPSTLQKTQEVWLAGFGFFFSNAFRPGGAFAAQGAPPPLITWTAAPICRARRGQGAPWVPSHIRGLAVAEHPGHQPIRMQSRDPKAPFPGDLRVPRSRHGHVVTRAEPHPWMGMPELALLACHREQWVSMSWLWVGVGTLAVPLTLTKNN